MTKKEKIIALNNLIDDLENLGKELDKTKKELEGKNKNFDDNLGNAFDAYKELAENMKEKGQDVNFKSLDDFINDDPSLIKKMTYNEFTGEEKGIPESFTYIVDGVDSNSFTKKMTKI